MAAVSPLLEVGEGGSALYIIVWILVRGAQRCCSRGKVVYLHVKEGKKEAVYV
jgi:hypothetical protein